MNRTDKRVLIYGGTTEGRWLAETLCGEGISCTVCVATEYGEMVMKPLPGLCIRKGRMNAEEMEQFTEAGGFFAVVDATHPFAAEASFYIKKSLEQSGVPYFRVKRAVDEDGHGDKEKQGLIFRYPDMESCAAALEQIEGNILLTTGSKELPIFAGRGLGERLFVRVLPSAESIALCEKEGICGRQIIAMQGPFLAELNEALLEQFKISCLVTKESGKAGGYAEKLEAAARRNTAVMVIGNPEKKAQGYFGEEVIRKVMELAGQKRQQSLPEQEQAQRQRVALIGMGMGGEGQLTVEAKKELEQAEVLFGAERLLQNYRQHKECYPYYLAADILPRLAELSERKPAPERIAVLFSGDTGFYSGAQGLFLEMKKKGQQHKSNREICVFPGISSISYLASKLGLSWNDAEIVSLHGREADIVKTAAENRKTFALVSGAGDMRKIGEQFCSRGLGGVTIHLGCQLSYPEEEIRSLTPAECMQIEKEGLYCCFIENNSCSAGNVVHGLKDDCFIRDKVPMTKEEVREISICKLKLTKEAVVYDIGSGTGSIAVEMALLSSDIKVFAIEKNPQAAELIRKNCAKFGTKQIQVVETLAPEGLEELPVPTHAFIGGSGGNLTDILHVLYRKNPVLRVVINAVTLETAAELAALLKEFPVAEEDLVQIQVSRARAAGAYHLMQAENPVYILSFRFQNTQV